MWWEILHFYQLKKCAVFSDRCQVISRDTEFRLNLQITKLQLLSLKGIPYIQVQTCQIVLANILS